MTMRQEVPEKVWRRWLFYIFSALAIAAGVTTGLVSDRVSKIYADLSVLRELSGQFAQKNDMIRLLKRTSNPDLLSPDFPREAAYTVWTIIHHTDDTLGLKQMGPADLEELKEIGEIKTIVDYNAYLEKSGVRESPITSTIDPRVAALIAEWRNIAPLQSYLFITLIISQILALYFGVERERFLPPFKAKKEEES